MACDHASGPAYPAGTAFTFTNPAGFGTGTHGGSTARISAFHYAWNTLPVHTFTGEETPWSENALIMTPAPVSAAYYLHLQSFNAEGVPGGTLSYGPFEIDALPPGAPVVTGPVLTSEPRPTWTWTSGGGGSGYYVMELDASGVWTSTTMEAFTPVADLAEGPHTLHVRERDGAGNWSASGAHTLTVSLAALGGALHLLGPEETGADSVAFRVTFSRAVAPTFNTGAVSLAGALSGSVTITGADPEYTVTVQLADPDADGPVGIIIPGGMVSDTLGNVYAGGTSPQYKIFNWHEPWFLEIPAGARKYSGNSHILRVTPNCGASTMTYQWRGNTTAKAAITGPTTPEWSLAGLTPAQAGAYWCEVSYDGVLHATPSATLEVEPPLLVVTPPSGGTKTPGASHRFAVIATGGYDPLAYEWYKDGEPLSGWPDASEYTLADLGVEDSGVYTVTVSDSNGTSVTTTGATLTVAESPLPAVTLPGMVLAILGIIALGGRYQGRPCR